MGATAHATISNGVVTAVTIDNPGRGYTTLRVVIAPPFEATAPTLRIDVNKIRVTMNVTPGLTHQLQSSPNLAEWTPVGEAFLATQGTMSIEYDVSTVGRYFRIQEVQ